jgi:hypothetical protein
MSDEHPRNPRLVRPLRWGLWAAAGYLVVTVPCVVIFYHHMQEYSPFAYIAHYASYPGYLILIGFFRDAMNAIERLPHWSNLIGYALLIGVSACVYFAGGVAAGLIFRALRALLRKGA